ncbi:MAG: type toxin-antitoxin system death-on-curing family toxin [Firmicutes bacterium]|nr:type toxin-antitoxin system death-on-curing family toxin [Bacillota bacterium]
MRYITLEEVIYIYTEIIKRSNGRAGIKEEAVLEDVLAKPMVTFEGEELYPDLFTKVAVLIFAFINSRPFISENKCVAVLGALFILRVNGYHLTATQESLVNFINGIEEGKHKVDHLISWLRKNAVPV